MLKKEELDKKDIEDLRSMLSQYKGDDWKLLMKVIAEKKNLNLE